MAAEKHILIVEDEVKIAEILRDYFALEGFTSTLVHHGDDVVKRVKELEPTAIILDRMLPGIDGLTLCKQLRQFSNVPILMLTARVDEIDRLLGLESGADDYVCKPFSAREVVARIQTILRRTLPQTPAGSSRHLSYQDIHLDIDAYECKYEDKPVELTPVEFRFLKTLIQKPGVVVTREQLMRSGYEDGRIVSHRTIDSHMKNLRHKLTGKGNESPIQAVYAMGYKLV